MPDMIVFGEDWGRHPSSTQHFVRRLAVNSKVIWVNSLGLRRPRVSTADLARLKSKAVSTFRAKSSGQQADPHPFATLVNPKAIPWPGSRLAAAVNRRTLAAQIKPLIAANEMKRPIVWTSLPTALPVIGALGERAVVYYAGDDFGALAGVDHRPVLAMERQLAEKADLVIAASPLIAERFASHKTRVLPHGVDFDLFAQDAPRADDLPSGRPVAGFYGSLNGWIDVEALAKAACALPDWDFVLIGNVETDITGLRACRNVHFPGPRAHHELPHYSRHWDVSLLPFRRNRQIDASNPLKMREYLAAGTPVAASYLFPAALPFADAILTPQGSESLSDIILRAKNDSRPKAWRQSLVQDESWDTRVATLQSWLGAL